MIFTLNDALGLEVFRRARAEVVTPAGQLSPEVRWVHLPERLSIAPGHLRGGELVIIAGFDLPSSAEAQRTIIRELAAVPIAALVMELGRVWNEVPPAVIEEATARDLPIIALRRPTRFVEITEQVSAAIINRHYQLLQKAEQIERRFDALLLSGASLEQLLCELARSVSNPVVLENASHEVVAHAERSRPLPHLLTSWLAHAAKGHEGPAGGVVPSEGGKGVCCAWTPVILHGEIWGRLHVIAVEHEIRTEDQLALSRAVTAVGVTLLSNRNADHVVNRAQSILLSDVLNGRIPARSALKESAMSIGVDFGEGPMWALAVVRPSAPGADDTALSDTGNRLPDGLLTAVRESFDSAHPPLVSGIVGDAVLGFVSVGRETQSTSAFAPLLERLRGDGTTLPAAVGVSDVDNDSVLRQTLLEAQEAAAYAAIRGGGLARFSELKFNRVLLRLDAELSVPRYIEAELGPLLEMPARQRTKLIETLRLFLHTNGNRAATAADLGIQRRSLYARLHAIENALHCSLNDAETRVNLYLALRSLDLTQRVPALRRTPDQSAWGRTPNQSA